MEGTILERINYYVHLCVLPTIILFGVMGNLCNIFIVTRPSLRRSCSTYFLAGAINGLTLLFFGSSSRWLAHSFEGFDATEFSPFFCRFRNYVVNVIYNLAPYFIACVTIDRFCSSSPNANIRRWSAQPHLAPRVVLTIVLITMIAFIHIPIYFTIIDSSCQTCPGFYTQFFPFFATVYYFFAVCLIILFGLGTIRNVRAQAKRIQPVNKVADRRRMRNDGQLLLMLLAHLICYTCFAVPYHVTLIAAAVRPSLFRNATFAFIQNMGIIALNFNQGVG